MTERLAITPLRYRPDVEQIEPEEPQIARDLAETMLSIAHKTYADSGHAMRCVHTKSHGLLAARLEVLADLPPELAQGISTNRRLTTASSGFQRRPVICCTIACRRRAASR